MDLFYKFMIRMSDIELQIAQATGRNPDHIRELKAQLAYWKAEAHRYNVRSLA